MGSYSEIAVIIRFKHFASWNLGINNGTLEGEFFGTKKHKSHKIIEEVFSLRRKDRTEHTEYTKKDYLSQRHRDHGVYPENGEFPSAEIFTRRVNG